MDTNVNRGSMKLWKGLKLITVALCLVAFVANSYIIFQQFLTGKTVTSNDVQKNARLFLPSITLCSLSGFKEEIDELADLELDEYLNKTTRLDEILIDVADSNDDHLSALNITELSFLNGVYEEPGKWKLLSTYSLFKGRCHTIEYNKEASNFT